MIPVSQPFLPPRWEYEELIDQLWETKWLTNNGAYVQELERELKKYLSVSSLHFVANGTLAIQLSLQALGIKKEVITTPFSFVATTSSLLWEHCQPIFVDIDRETLCIDAEMIENAITDHTEAILATHVFGIPCNVERIEAIAKKYSLRVIYDGAHAFGVTYKGKSLLSYGDFSTLSFHATKLFHSVEGGAVIHNSGADGERIVNALQNFGASEEGFNRVGINGKNSEFHAAMGLCNLRYIHDIISKRKKLSLSYDQCLEGRLLRPRIPKHVQYNYAYYPIIFPTEEELIMAQHVLKSNGIDSRRYFYPSLNTLSYLDDVFHCPISEDVSAKILCLPLYPDLSLRVVEEIARLILESLTSKQI